MKRLALIQIIGRKDAVLPIVGETTTGFICRIGQHDSPATEWFPFSSLSTTAVEITE